MKAAHIRNADKRGGDLSKHGSSSVGAEEIYLGYILEIGITGM